MRALALVSLLGAASVSAQPFFAEDFEGPTARLDAGGVWSEIYDVASPRQTLGAAAHRGAAGFRVQRLAPDPASGADTQLERVMQTVNAGEWWVRWWMRVNATQLGPQAVMNFGDTSVPNHLGLAHDSAGLFVTGFESTGTFIADRAADRPDAGWHLYELGVFGMATADGGVTLVIDGQLAFSRNAVFNFPDAGLHQVNVGFTYADQQTFVGTVDYDDFRAHRTRPTGAVRVAGLNGPWEAGECVMLRIDFSASDGSNQRAAELERTVTLTTTPQLTTYSDPSCTIPMGTLTFPAGSFTSMAAFVRPPTAGSFRVQVSEPDLLPGGAILQVQEARDAGRPDAGVADAGVVDAGVVDAGVVDAGVVDAGVVDAGVVDAGVADAGLLDAGVSDAGILDAGVDGGLIDAGFVDAGSGPMSLAVGCSCAQVPTGSTLLMLAALALARRRRVFTR